MEHTHKHGHKHGPVAVVHRFMRRRFRLPLQVMGAVTLLMTLMGFSAFRPGPGPERANQAPSGAAMVTAEGEVESLIAKSAGSPFEGPVAHVAVRPGQKVKRGDLLFRMDTRVLEQTLAAARAEEAAAAQAFRQARAERARDLREGETVYASLRAEIAREQAAARRAPQAPVAEETQEMGLALDGTVVEDVQTVEEQPVEVNSARLEELQAQLQQVSSQLAERRQTWAPAVAEAASAHAAATAEVRRLKSLIAMADRKSSIAGTVTAVRAHPGQWVAASVPVVRVDDPAGYRVVAVVDKKVREALKPGVTLPVHNAWGRSGGKLEKIVAGWDEELFQYYLWVKPGRPEGMKPGQTVQVSLPAESTLTASVSF